MSIVLYVKARARFVRAANPATVSREIGRAAALHRGLASLDNADGAPDPSFAIISVETE